MLRMGYALEVMVSFEVQFLRVLKQAQQA